MAVTLLMMAINMNAQEGYEDTKHEVSVALGVGSSSKLLDDYHYYGCYSKNEKYIGPISAEYFYHINKWLGIGSIFAFGNYKEDLYYYGYGSYPIYSSIIVTKKQVKDHTTTIRCCLP